MDRPAAGEAQWIGRRFIARWNPLEPEPDDFAGASDLVVVAGAGASVPQRNEDLAQFRDERADLRVLSIALITVLANAFDCVAGHQWQNAGTLGPRQQLPELGPGFVARKVLLVEILRKRHRHDQAYADLQRNARHQPIAALCQRRQDEHRRMRVRSQQLSQDALHNAFESWQILRPQIAMAGHAYDNGQRRSRILSGMVMSGRIAVGVSSVVPVGGMMLGAHAL